jgi:hypothetical protein
MHVVEPVTLWNALSGSSQIVSNGVKIIPDYSGPPGGLNPLYGYSDDYSWYLEARARTCVGLNRESEKLVIFTVDEAGASEGMSLDEVADLLIKDYEVENALNLDGGGSTTLVLEDPATGLGRVANEPSDGLNGRAAGSNLAIFAEPAMGLRLEVIPAGCLILSWPASSGGWRLQQNSRLQALDWADVNAPQSINGNRVQVRAVLDREARFYRLTK